MYPKELQQALNEIANRYAPQFKAAVKQAFLDPKYKATGELGISVKVKVVPANDNEAPKIVLYYEQYGEYLGLRRLTWTKQPPIDEIAEWVKAKGAGFREKAIPGYANGAPNLSQDKKDKRIAFAIAKALKFRERFTRRYKWKSASLPTILKPMNRDLIDAWREETEQLIAKSLTTKPN